MNYDMQLPNSLHIYLLYMNYLIELLYSYYSFFLISILIVLLKKQKFHEEISNIYKVMPYFVNKACQNKQPITQKIIF